MQSFYELTMEWQTLHRWQLDHRKQSNQSISDLLDDLHINHSVCDIESYFVSLLGENGGTLSPSSRPSSPGLLLRKSLLNYKSSIETQAVQPSVSPRVEVSTLITEYFSDHQSMLNDIGVTNIEAAERGTGFLVTFWIDESALVDGDVLLSLLLEDPVVSSKGVRAHHLVSELKRVHNVSAMCCGSSKWKNGTSDFGTVTAVSLGHSVVSLAPLHMIDTSVVKPRITVAELDPSFNKYKLGEPDTEYGYIPAPPLMNKIHDIAVVVPHNPSDLNVNVVGCCSHPITIRKWWNSALSLRDQYLRNLRCVVGEGAATGSTSGKLHLLLFSACYTLLHPMILH